MTTPCATPRLAVRRRAMTLPEVLATLVLVGIVLPAAMHGVSLSLQAAARARHQQEAAMLADGKLNEALALRDPAALAGGGTFAPDFPEYRWELQQYAADFGLSEVVVTVFWTERGREQSLSLTTLVLPPASDSGSAGSIGFLSP